MLRLTIVTNNVYAFGGGEKWSLELAKRLANRFKITVVNIHSKREPKRKTREDIKKEYRLDNFELLDLYATGLKSSAFGKEEYIFRIPHARSAVALYKIIKNSDIVYQVSFNPVVFFYSLSFSKMLKKKFIFGVHNPVFFKIFQEENAGNKALRFFLSQVRYFHVLNSYDFDLLKRNMPSAKIIKIPIFITKNTKKVEINKMDFVVLYVGRLAKDQKGIDLLKKIIETVISKNKEVRFHIVGAGGDGEDEVRQLAEKHHNSVKYLGFLNDRDMESEYAKASLSILPSRYEGLPAVLIEAQLHGVPFVAFNVKGPTEIFKEKIQGNLVEPFDTDKFAYEILRYFVSWSKNKNDYLKTKIKIKKLTEQAYDERTVIEKMGRMFENVTKQ